MPSSKPGSPSLQHLHLINVNIDIAADNINIPMSNLDLDKNIAPTKFPHDSMTNAIETYIFDILHHIPSEWEKECRSAHASQYRSEKPIQAPTLLKLVHELLQALESTPFTADFKEETIKHQGISFKVICFLDKVRIHTLKP
jgi:hypothetical protein